MRLKGKAPDMDVTIRCTIENGKALLEWETDWDGRADFFLKDVRGNVVLESYKMWGEEEPLQAVLLKPILWTGIENPHLYTLEILFRDRRGILQDTITEPFPLRSITRQINPVTEEETLLLNGEKFAWKTVQYHIPHQQQVLEDMRLMADLGVNSICLEHEEYPPSFLRLCDRFGLLMVTVEGDVPLFCGDENALLTPERKPTEAFYRYKSRWSGAPFVYLWPKSLKRQENGNYKVTCYSNCKKVALYTDGKFFELKQGQEPFTFEEIPVKGPCVVLSAEGEGCSMSLSIHRNFTNLSRIGDI